MDTLIERKPGINRKRLYWVGGVMLGLAVIAYFIFRDTDFFYGSGERPADNCYCRAR